MSLILSNGVVPNLSAALTAALLTSSSSSKSDSVFIRVPTPVPATKNDFNNNNNSSSGVAASPVFDLPTPPPSSPVPSVAAAPDAFAQVLKRHHCTSHSFAGPEALKAIAADIIVREQLDDTFFIVDLMNAQRLYNAWTAAIPRIKPFYAMKCCPEPALVEALCALSCGFDCASAAEIKLAIDSGCPADRIIFAHPCKKPSDIRYAKQCGVNLTTFDCVGELEKIAQHHQQCGVVLRIRADDPTALLPLGTKYGATMEEVDMLLAKAKSLQLDVVGVSFHVGSMARDARAFELAIAKARTVFDMAEQTYGFQHMTLLDIGGGFTGRFDADGNVISMKPGAAIPTVINAALAKYFPENDQTLMNKVNIISEPGRYFAETSMHLLTHVHGKILHSADQAFNEFWISDGLYGSLNNIIYDSTVPRAWIVPSPQLGPLPNPADRMPATVYGPTCDSLDVVFKDVMLPELRVGDWLMFPYFGAYSWAGATNFNGIQAASCPKFCIQSDCGVDDKEVVKSGDSGSTWDCEMTVKPSSLVA